MSLRLGTFHFSGIIAPWRQPRWCTIGIATWVPFLLMGLLICTEFVSENTLNTWVLRAFLAISLIMLLFLTGMIILANDTGVCLMDRIESAMNNVETTVRACELTITNPAEFLSALYNGQRIEIQLDGTDLPKIEDTCWSSSLTSFWHRTEIQFLPDPEPLRLRFPKASIDRNTFEILSGQPMLIGAINAPSAKTDQEEITPLATDEPVAALV